MKVTKTPPHPDHSDDLKRTRRIKGQLEGIEKMIVDRRYCPEIINQVQASISALISLKKVMLERHLRHCVAKAFSSKDDEERDAKIAELLDLVGR
jgi:CsoR family transcriptional regulator, copper-sensing transcriptional repressor